MRFNSKWFNPQAEAMNFLLQNWEEEINWIEPPKLLLRAPYAIKKKKKTVKILKQKWTFNFKIFDAILPTHVPSNFLSKFIVLKTFDPDAAVAVALVLAKCSPED